VRCVRHGQRGEGKLRPPRRHKQHLRASRIIAGWDRREHTRCSPYTFFLRIKLLDIGVGSRAGAPGRYWSFWVSDQCEAVILDRRGPTGSPRSGCGGISLEVKQGDPSLRSGAADAREELVDASSELEPALPCRRHVLLPSITDVTQARVVEVWAGTSDARPIRDRSWST
jgi:hypothetical protein